MRDRLSGLRIMVVEDELLIFMLIEDVLADAGCKVIGPFTTLDDATVAARRETFDAALLDVNLRGAKVYPVAEILDERSIPFVLLSGYGSEAIPADRDWCACSKPFNADDLLRALSERIAA
jgi:DNA-binding response OmpR family regulator